MSKTTALIALLSSQVLPVAIGDATAPEWVHLLPSGEVATVDDRGPYSVGDLQAVIKASFTEGDKLPIDQDHSTDLAAPNGHAAPARGWIVGLEARADGLWGKVEWTKVGLELLADRAYRGISPVIVHDTNNNIVAVLRASLVNQPNLRGLTALHSQNLKPTETNMSLLALTYGGPANGARFRSCFDVAGNIIAAESSTVETQSYTPTVGSGVATMQLTVYKSDIDAFQCELGDTATGYVTGGFAVSDEVILPQSEGASASRWAGYSLDVHGDSLVAMGSYASQITQALGTVTTLHGVGGRRASGDTGLHTDAAVAEVPASTQIPMQLIGVNDWAQSVPLGLPDSEDTDTFYGALNVLARKKTLRHPLARIVWLTPPYVERAGALLTGWSDLATNTQGLTIRAYAKCIEEVAYNYGFPVIDLCGRCGWNTHNIGPFMVDDAGNFHPDAIDDDETDIFNDNGGDRLAEIIVGGLEALQPLI